TLSKSPTQFVQGATPIYLERGRGAHVWDVDGNEYIDYPMALGPVILGHAEPVVDAAITAQLRDGITFTLMHPLEVDVAERIVALDAGSGRVAAVVIEPAGATVPEPGYLQTVVDLAHSAGALAIFDEVITGFRLAPGGARERYGVIPDFSCYGKALGNGMPISAVAGTWDVMRVFEDVFYSGTHGGEALSLAAAAAVLDTVADGRLLKDIEVRGRRMLEGIDARIAKRGVGDRVTVGGE